MKTLVAIGPFDAKDYGNVIEVYPFHGNTFHSVSIRKPHDRRTLLSEGEKMDPATVSWASFMEEDLVKVEMHARCILAAVGYARKLSREAIPGWKA